MLSRELKLFQELQTNKNNFPVIAPISSRVVYQHKKPFIYQDKLLKAQAEAEKKKLGLE